MRQPQTPTCFSILLFTVQHRLARAQGEHGREPVPARQLLVAASTAMQLAMRTEGLPAVQCFS